MPTTDPSRSSFEALTEGTVVGGYRIERALAEGGMGAVYEAVHSVLPRRVAIKVMHGSLIDDAAATERLLQEARILETLDHPGLVAVHDCGVLSDGRPWFAMELVAGCTLCAHTELFRSVGAAEVTALIRDIADVLANAHAAGAIHRDLKPENILLASDPGFPVRVIDWGISRWASAPTRVTRGNMIPGTPMYMAPEQARGKAVDGRCDIYSLGVIAYEALAGAPPFEGDSAVDVLVQTVTAEPASLAARCPSAPPELVALVERMMIKDPAARPTAVEVRDEAARLSATAATQPEAPAESLEHALASLLAEHLEGDDYDSIDVVADPIAPRFGHPRWTPAMTSADPALGLDHGAQRGADDARDRS